MTSATSIYERGLAIGSLDIAAGAWHFRFRDENFVVKSPMLENKRPSRCMRIFQIPELRYGMCADIDEVRICAEKP